MDCSFSDSAHLSFSDSADDEPVERRPMTDNPSLTKQSRIASADRTQASHKAIERLFRVENPIVNERVKNWWEHALRRSRDLLRHLGPFDKNYRELSLRNRWEMYLESFPKRFFSSRTLNPLSCLRLPTSSAVLQGRKNGVMPPSEQSKRECVPLPCREGHHSERFPEVLPLPPSNMHVNDYRIDGFQWLC